LGLTPAQALSILYNSCKTCKKTRFL